MSDIEAAELPTRYTHFRILVIGRTNSGKTTLLKRVCNTDEDPCIYNEDNKNQLEPTAERGAHDIEREFTFKSKPQIIFHEVAFNKGEEKQYQDVLSTQMNSCMFCFYLDASRPLLELEQKFFNEKRAENVPVIAIFTKFDDLVVQVYDWDREEESRADALKVVQEKFETPLKKSSYRPQAYVCVEALDDDESDHQEQVKELIKKTVASLD